MAYLSSTMRTTLEARLARYETMLEAAYDDMDAGATGMHLERYKLDTGEGDQEVTRAPLRQLDKHILFLEAQIRHISQRLNGLGVVNLTMKRKS